jgi:hypothetical protein
MVRLSRTACPTAEPELLDDIGSGFARSNVSLVQASVTHWMGTVARARAFPRSGSGRCMRRSSWPLIALALAACGGGATEPPLPAIAFVTGRVFAMSGQPVADARLAITCAHADEAVATTDGAGRYVINLTASASTVGRRVACEFVVGTASAPRLRADTSLMFGVWGLPHPLQIVDLTEAAVVAASPSY